MLLPIIQDTVFQEKSGKRYSLFTLGPSYFEIILKLPTEVVVFHFKIFRIEVLILGFERFSYNLFLRHLVQRFVPVVFLVNFINCQNKSFRAGGMGSIEIAGLETIELVISAVLRPIRGVKQNKVDPFNLFESQLSIIKALLGEIQPWIESWQRKEAISFLVKQLNSSAF